MVRARDVDWRVFADVVMYYRTRRTATLRNGTSASAAEPRPVGRTHERPLIRELVVGDFPVARQLCFLPDERPPRGAGRRDRRGGQGHRPHHRLCCWPAVERRVAVVEAREVGAVATGDTTAKVSPAAGDEVLPVAALPVRARRHCLRRREPRGAGLAAALLRGPRRRRFNTVPRSPMRGGGRAPHRAQGVRRGEVARSRRRVARPARRALSQPRGRRARGPGAVRPDGLPAGACSPAADHGGTLHQGLRVKTSRGPERPRSSSRTAPRRAPSTWCWRPVCRSSTEASTSPRWSRSAPTHWPSTSRTRRRGCTSPRARLPVDPGRAGQRRDPAAGRRQRAHGRSHPLGADHVERLRSGPRYFRRGGTHQWSAQDYSPGDGVPLVGLLPRGLGRIYVATGFDKWGMTNGVAAARAISGRILGEEPSWAKPMSRRSIGPAAVASWRASTQGRPGCGRLGDRRRTTGAVV